MPEQGTQDWGANPTPTSQAAPGIWTTSDGGKTQTKTVETTLPAPGQHG
jgi:hypothetical protein